MGEMTPEMVERVESEIREYGLSAPVLCRALETLLTAWRRGEERIKELEEVLAFHAQASKDSDAHIRSLAKQRNDAERSLAEARAEREAAIKESQESHQEAQETLAERNGLRSELDQEQKGRLEIRERYGALEHETFGMFVRRLAGERDEAREKLAEVAEALDTVEDGLRWASPTNWELVVDRARAALAAAKGEKG